MVEAGPRVSLDAQSDAPSGLNPVSILGAAIEPIPAATGTGSKQTMEMHRMSDSLLTPEQQRRQPALKSMDRFADQNGVTNREWVERDHGDAIALIGTTNDGRDFAISYTTDALHA